MVALQHSGSRAGDTPMCRPNNPIVHQKGREIIARVYAPCRPGDHKNYAPFFTMWRTNKIATIKVNQGENPNLVCQEYFVELFKSHSIDGVLCYADGDELHFVEFVNPLVFIFRKYCLKPYMNLLHKRRTTALGKIYTRIIPILKFGVFAAMIYTCSLLVYWAFQPS